MKISPMGQGTGVPGANIGQVTTGRISPEKIAAAKAIAQGQEPTVNDPQAERILNSRKIKMKTNFSTDREEQIEPESTIESTPETPEVEATKPLSPQFAALAKQKRAIQQERMALDAEKKAFAEERAGKDAGGLDVERLKSDPLGVMSEHGISYDQLTEAILNGTGNTEVAELRAKIAQLEKGVEEKFTSREQQQETQVLAEMQRDADRMVAQGDDYAVTRAKGMSKAAIDLIHRTYKETGEVLDVREALDEVENELVEEELKIAALPKLRSRLTPPQEAQQSAQKQMRTLTSRDSGSPQMSRRQRAIAAALGTLK